MVYILYLLCCILDILPYDILMFTFFYPYTCIIKMPAPDVQMCIFKIRLYEIKEKVIVKIKPRLKMID